MLFPDRTRTLLAGAAGFVFIIAASESIAQTAPVNVSALIEEECTLTTESMAFPFGVYEGDQIQRTSDVIFDCPQGKTVEFTITGGQFEGAGIRFLPNVDTGGTTTPLSYQILSPNSLSMVDGIIYSVQTNGGSQTETFTAFLAAGQTGNGYEPGNYQEELTLTMSVQ